MRFFCNFLLTLIILYIAQNAYATELLPAFSKLPVILKADTVKYNAQNNSVAAIGNIYISMEDYTLRADNLYYDINKDILFIEGNIRIKDKEGKIIKGVRAVLKDKLKQGLIEEFILQMPDNSLLIAAYAERQDEKRVYLHQSAFTACKITCDREPIWQIKSKNTEIDYYKEKIIYKGMFFEVFGLPVAYLPYFSHPLPSAPAQSGILIPHIKQDNFILPLYLRAKPNLDFTISPRISNNYTIFEGNVRYLNQYGSYDIVGSYGNPSYNKKSEDSKPGRYHIFTKGNFYKDNLNYGFDINRTSDKAYLTNYFENYDSYLESKIYITKVDKTDYNSLESYAFQRLKTEDKKNSTPFVLPRIRTQKIIGLNENETVFLKIKNDALIYNNYEEEQQLGRNALELSLNNNIITPTGHLINFALTNRYDVYVFNSTDLTSNLEKEKVLSRNIPEFSTIWRYPLIRNSLNNLSIKLEPIAALAIGKNYEKKFDKFALIDFNRYELSEYNLFNTNRVSGIDYHDYGKRFSYGINTSLSSGQYYFNVFIGQLIYKNNFPTQNNSNYVGSASIEVADNLKLYYRFRKDKKLNPIMNEMGISTFTDKLTTNLSFSNLNNIAKNYSEDTINFPKNNISQINTTISYQILPSLKFDTGIRFDISKKTNLLQRSIMVTYVIDCVSITGKFYDNFTHDVKRRIKKTSTKTFMVGFKVLNM